MDLSVVHKRSEVPDPQDTLTDRPKFSFSVASLLASRGIRLPTTPSPPSSPPPLDEEEESDISVEDDDPLQTRLEEGDDASPRGYAPRSPGSYPPREESPEGRGASPPRLAMPTPLLGGRFPLPPGLQGLQGLGLPPGWPGLMPNPLSSLNSALFKSGLWSKKLL